MTKILMVCMGNICRSPLAEGILKVKLGAAFKVDSAGTISLHEGEHPDKRAVEIAKKHNLDISTQVARPITQADLGEYDKIYCMDLEIMKEVISLARNEEERQKIKLYLVEAGESGENTTVPDPYWSEMDVFEKVYQLLDEGADKIAAKLRKN